MTYESTLQLLQTEGWTFHAILNNPILDSDGIGSVEQSRSQWKVYDEDTDPKTGSGYKETIVYSDPVGLGPGKPDYTGLAYGTDGAVWDLNKLREGGFTTKAFGEIFVNTTTEIIIDDIASNAPTMSPRPFSPTSPAPSRNPVTTAPTAEPNLCSTTNVLACVKNTSEATFRAVLRIMLQGVLNETELSGVIPSLADELNSKAVQLAVQAQLCLFLANPLSFDVGAAAASIFSATLGSLNPVQLAKVTLDSITSNIDLTPERGFKLFTDLGAIFTQGVDPNAVVGDLFTILINAIQQSVFECLGLNLPAPPPPAPTPISNWFCFSGHATVEVQGQGTTRMDELKIGDSILAVGGLYSTVYSFGHFEPSRATAFLQIFAEGMIQPIEITPDHLLYMRSNENDKVGSIVPAGHVKVGDFLVTAVQPEVSRAQGIVRSIRVVQRQGMYAPFTETGNLMVSGVAASSYLALPTVWQRVVSFDGQHRVQHAAYRPYQFYCRFLAPDGCADETYDEATGLTKAVTFWLPLLHGVEWILVNLLVVTTVIAASILSYCYVVFQNRLTNQWNGHFYKQHVAMQ